MFSVQARCCVSEKIRRRNIELSAGYSEPAGNGRLAIVGGGPSIRAAAHLIPDQDIWAVNGAARYCVGLGLKRVSIYSVDPEPLLAELCDPSIESAVFAAHCDPSAYEAMKGRKVYRIDAFGGPGPTSAVAATVAALRYGYEGVDFYGCESSYEETTHAYDWQDDLSNLMKVRAGKNEYLTKPELLSQAQQLASAINRFPKLYTDKSGGLLSALIENGDDWEVVAVSKHMNIEKRPTEQAA